MNTEMTPSNGMSSLNTDAMTSSQRLWPNPSPQLEHYASVTSCWRKGFLKRAYNVGKFRLNFEHSAKRIASPIYLVTLIRFIGFQTSIAR
jgi:hypothetical protein